LATIPLAATTPLESFLQTVELLLQIQIAASFTVRCPFPPLYFHFFIPRSSLRADPKITPEVSGPKAYKAGSTSVIALNPFSVRMLSKVCEKVSLTCEHDGYLAVTLGS
jgi:hypothetical protein